MNKFQVGDKAVDSQRGKCIVINDDIDDDNYPIIVRFDNGQTDAYTPEGYVCFDVNIQCLFHLNGYIPPSSTEPNRLPDYPVDTKMLVGINDTRRYFSHWNNEGDCCCFEDGRTSFTTHNISPWEEWSLYEGDK